MTVIVKDVKKGVVFKKGHAVRKEDIPELLALGKDKLYIGEKDESMLHEDEAAESLRDVCMGKNMRAPNPSEGRTELIVTCDGLLTIRRAGRGDGGTHRREHGAFAPLRHVQGHRQAHGNQRNPSGEKTGAKAAYSSTTRNLKETDGLGDNILHVENAQLSLSPHRRQFAFGQAQIRCAGRWAAFVGRAVNKRDDPPMYGSDQRIFWF